MVAKWKEGKVQINSTGKEVSLMNGQPNTIMKAMPIKVETSKSTVTHSTSIHPSINRTGLVSSSNRIGNQTSRSS